MNSRRCSSALPTWRPNWKRRGPLSGARRRHSTVGIPTRPCCARWQNVLAPMSGSRSPIRRCNCMAVTVILLEGAGERGLCAGGDIRALWESSKVKGDLGKSLWREEYILNARIKKFPKPYVAFMDGIVMGGGVGLSAHSSHRVVTEKT